MSMSTVSTHAPRAGSDTVCTLRVNEVSVSTHAPRAGSDSTNLINGAKPWFQLTLPERGATFPYSNLTFLIVFQLTLPERGATCPAASYGAALQFQLTLPERGATHGIELVCIDHGFNSRSPSGERRTVAIPPHSTDPFQLTLPERGATFV